MEETFVLIKPDGVQRGLIGKIMERFEQRGLFLEGLKFVLVSRELAEEHYGEHKEKPFFEGLVSFITSSPVVAMVWAGDNAVETVRTMIGKTNPLESLPGTIRADFGMSMGRNLVHASDSIERAQEETRRFFMPEELVSWKDCKAVWIYE